MLRLRQRKRLLIRQPQDWDSLIPLILSVIALVGAPWFAEASRSAVPEAVLDGAIRPWVAGGWTTGVALGIITPDGERFMSWGRVRRDRSQAPDPNTLYAIGSLTKLFTATILAEMVVQHRLALSDPVQNGAPAGLIIPRFGNHQITWLDLADHSSGLPLWPSQMCYSGARPTDADGGLAWLRSFLATFRLVRPPGEQYQSSNLGYGLLGYLIANLDGLPFSVLVSKHITGPLRMTDTMVSPSQESTSRVAPGYSANGDLLPSQDTLFTGGAGALWSTSHDLLKFLALHLDSTNPRTPLAKAAQLTHIPRIAMDGRTARAMGWIVDLSPRILWAPATIGGYRAFMGFAPAQRVGMVLLTNSSCLGSDDLGRQLLLRIAGLPSRLALPPRTIRITTTKLHRLLGYYRFSLFHGITVRLDGLNLVADGGRYGTSMLRPLSETEFVDSSLEGTASFEMYADGRALGARFKLWGRDLQTRKVE